MLRFIFYVILFYLTIKVLNAFFRWLKTPKSSGNTGTNENSNYSKPAGSRYKNIEEAQFTEIETQTKKEKAQE